MVPADSPQSLGTLTVSTSPTAPLATTRQTGAFTLVTDAAEAERQRLPWEALQERALRNELTQSPDWLLTWWSAFGGLGGRQLRLGLFHDGGRLIGLAPLLRRRHWYGRALPFRRLELLASGEPEAHGIYSNHVGVLAERGAEEEVAGRLARTVVEGAFGRWDEVVLPMMSGDTPLPGLLADAFRSTGMHVELTETARAPYAPLPATWDAYLEGLSADSRRSVKRSLKAFEAWAGGELRLERVTGLEDLDRGKQMLVRLHQERWAADDQSGVFHSPHYLQFHDAIMRRLASRGALWLVWLCARGEPVAVLYGMEHAGKVSAYQTGRKPDLPEQLRPGAVLLALAMRQAVEAGLQEFDLQADEAPYKLQLAPQLRSLVQLRVARKSVVEGLRRAARSCVKRLRSLRRRVDTDGARSHK